IFSVSPIRYWKDGAHENNISKSVLFLAIDVLQKKFENVTYFPAYEILMDELRDYRFYDEDMIHPSAFAIKYIWKKFSDTYFSEITQKIVQRVEQLLNDFKHKPMHPESEEYKEFLLHIQHRKEQLLSDFPFLAERLQKSLLL
ncbi:MAG TPA: GSCFA domain-containing protein, partial [Paludibacteraceae bacterium]|nr:GSCFA domain-containing protein [Paludibacteraceae bacterium]